jgi:nitroimidazol reductase NimA-like FMN-containing flavoprotein (pyridoxamine 5'-phosphate oxidase superfamily)
MATIDPRTGMTVLDEAACWELFTSAEVARLAIVVGDDLEIFPINPVVDKRAIFFRTGEGTKLAAVTIARKVAIEADGYDASAGEAWSVVVKGDAERLERFDDIERAEQLPLRSWSDHPKQWFVRVRPRQITGRRFAVANL